MKWVKILLKAIITLSITVIGANGNAIALTESYDEWVDTSRMLSDIPEHRLKARDLKEKYRKTPKKSSSSNKMGTNLKISGRKRLREGMMEVLPQKLSLHRKWNILTNKNYIYRSQTN